MKVIKNILRISFALAKAVICGEGSEPIESIHIRGVLGSDSIHVDSKFKMTASPYSGPSDSLITTQNIHHIN